MKNTFSPIELQVILNLLDAGSIAYVEADMLREKIQRLKANPPTLRETAAQFITDLIDGTIEDPNPQRFEAAKVVLEAYWSFDESELEPSLEPHKLDRAGGESQSNSGTYSMKIEKVRGPNGAESNPKSRFIEFPTLPEGADCWQAYGSSSDQLAGPLYRIKADGTVIDLAKENPARTYVEGEGRFTPNPDWKENLAAGVENGLKFADMNERPDTRIETVVPPNNIAEHSVECPFDCDSKHAHEVMRHQAKQQNWSMKGSARIKDPDCSTPKESRQELNSSLVKEDRRRMTPGADGPVRQYSPSIKLNAGIGGAGFSTGERKPFHAPVLTHLGNTPPGGLDFAKIAAEGGPVVEKEKFVALPPLYPPMTLERAVAVLNTKWYRSYSTWTMNSEGNKVAVFNGYAIAIELTEFEVIAIAEKLEREK